MDNNMKFDSEQQRSYDAATSGNNLFISGVGGVGKSYVIKSIAERLRSEGKKVVICAFTKNAAINIEGAGMTIFNAFNTYPSGLRFDELGLKRLKKSLAMDADVIIIDEISMCSKDLFTYVCKAIRHISWINDQKPIQLIVSGDFLQLPPVCKDQNVEYAFESPSWNTCDFIVTMLETQHRQNNTEYFDRLCQIRKGQNINDNLEYLKENSHYLEEKKDAVSLCSYRKDVRERNNEKIRMLPGESQIYIARTNSQKFLNSLTVWDELNLKIGTLVMTVYNDPNGKYYNGSTGHIIDMADNTVTVEFDDSTPEAPHIQEIGMCRWTEQVDKNDFYVEMLPVIPAYAVTIHKAQGCTLDYVNVNPRCFADGQLYVALSRVRDVNHLYINNEIRPQDIKVNPKVLDFYSQFEIKSKPTIKNMYY